MGKAYSGRYHEVHRLPILPGQLQAVERPARREDPAPRAGLGLQNPTRSRPRPSRVVTSARDRRTPGAGRDAAGLRQAPVHALRRPGLRLGLPGHGAAQGPRRRGRLRRGQVPGVPLLHLGLPLRRAHRGVGLAGARRSASARMCADRGRAATAAERNGQALPTEEQQRSGRAHAAGLRQAVPGRRAAATATATSCSPRRASASREQPGRYVDHVYGEKEAGGTAHALPGGRALRAARPARRRHRELPGPQRRRPRRGASGGDRRWARCSEGPTRCTARRARCAGQPGRRDAEHHVEFAPAARRSS